MRDQHEAIQAVTSPSFNTSIRKEVLNDSHVQTCPRKRNNYKEKLSDTKLTSPKETGRKSKLQNGTKYLILGLILIKTVKKDLQDTSSQESYIGLFKT